MAPAKTIIVHFESTDPMGYPFTDPHYFASFQAFSNFCTKNGVNFIICRGKTYGGTMQFNHGWIFSEQGLIPLDHTVKGDVIFSYGDTLPCSDNDKVMSHRNLMETCYSKWITFQLFKEFQAPTYLIDSKNYLEMLDKISTSLAVVKPVFGESGRDVWIGKKEDFDPILLSKSSEQFLVQEFIDSSSGIPEFLEGPHEIRLHVFNGEVKLCHIKRPKAGSYLSNIDQGGSFIYYPLAKLHPALLPIARKIDEQFKAYKPRFYAIDISFQQGKPYLMEINSQPALPYLEWEQQANYVSQYFNYLFDALTSVF